MGAPVKAQKRNVALLDQIGAQLRQELDAFAKLNAEGAWRSLRVGALLMEAKSILPHGEFTGWVTAHIDAVKLRQGQNCMALARAFAKSCELSDEKVFDLACDMPPKTLEKKARSFIGDKTQAELFAEHGIQVRAKKDKGGATMLQKWLKENYPDHVGKRLGDLPKKVSAEYHAWLKEDDDDDEPKSDKLIARDAWLRIIEQLRKRGLEDKSWCHLTQSQLDELKGVLTDLKRELRGVGR